MRGSAAVAVAMGLIVLAPIALVVLSIWCVICLVMDTPAVDEDVVQ